jgi:hypothetical protein
MSYSCVIYNTSKICLCVKISSKNQQYNDYDNSYWIIGKELLLNGYFWRCALHFIGCYDEENDGIVYYAAAKVLYLIIFFP